MKLDMVMMVAVLCWAASNCLHTAELSLKNLNNNKFQLDLKIGSRIERFRLVKKNAHVPTMLAQENGVIADVQSQVGNSQTSFNPDISQLNRVQTIKLNFTNSINYTKVLFSGGRAVRRY